MAEKGISTVVLPDSILEPPAYSVGSIRKPNGTRTSKLFWGVAFYAGAVTAALITVCVFVTVSNSFDLNDNDNREDVKHYSYAENDIVNTFDLDLGLHREVVRQRHTAGNESIFVFDFEQSVGGIFHAPTQHCFLTRDVEGMPDAEEMNNMFSARAVNKTLGGKREFELDFTADSAHDRSDLSIMPRELIEPCWGKHVYWISRLDNGNGERLKRGAETEEVVMRGRVIIIIIIIRCRCQTRQ